MFPSRVRGRSILSGAPLGVACGVDRFCGARGGVAERHDALAEFNDLVPPWVGFVLARH